MVIIAVLLDIMPKKGVKCERNNAVLRGSAGFVT